MGASRWQVLRYIVFPHMIPSFFAGMRLGMTGVLLGVLLAELYVSTAGIGYFTTLFTQNFDPTRLLGLISAARRHGHRAQRDRAAGGSAFRPMAHRLRGTVDGGKTQAHRRVRRLRDRARAQGRRGRAPTASISSCSPGWARASGTGAWRARPSSTCARPMSAPISWSATTARRCTAIPVSCTGASGTAFCSSTPQPASASRRT